MRVVWGTAALLTMIVAVYAVLRSSRSASPLGSSSSAPGQYAAPEPVRTFINSVVASTDEVWQAHFKETGQAYKAPSMVFFDGHLETPCGLAETDAGPFYCAKDERIYVDPGFFGELRSNLHAPGDFAGTFVIAHEIGHHVQKLLGIFDKVRAERARADDVKSNELSVRLELQADFLAGFWANRARKRHPDLVPADATAAVRAASAMGDDRLQKRAQGFDLPESFRHGTSAQRVRWFRRGFDSGDFSKGDTFALPYDEL